MQNAEIRKLFTKFSHLDRPNSFIFWANLGVTSLVFWGSCLLIFLIDHIAFAAFLFPFAVFSLYRGMLLIHEITHMRKKPIPFYKNCWNLVFGIPLLMPSYFFETHIGHHTKENFGTDSDPEYDYFVRSGKHVVILYLLSGLTLPPILFLRFSILPPIAAILPSFRHFLDKRGSSATIHNRYNRKIPSNKSKILEWRVQETFCFIYCWAIIAAISFGYIPIKLLVIILASAVLALSLNNIRTVTSHRFELNKGPHSLMAQVLDSSTFEAKNGLHSLWIELWAPLGLRYHALHHLFPNIPFHNLNKIHKEFRKNNSLFPDYEKTLEYGYWKTFKNLFSIRNT